MRGDAPFNHPTFRKYVLSTGAKFEPITPRWHQKKVLESKHGITHSISFLKYNAKVYSRLHTISWFAFAEVQATEILSQYAGFDT